VSATRQRASRSYPPNVSATRTTRLSPNVSVPAIETGISGTMRHAVRASGVTTSGMQKTFVPGIGRETVGSTPKIPGRHSTVTSGGVFETASALATTCACRESNAAQQQLDSTSHSRSGGPCSWSTQHTALTAAQRKESRRTTGRRCAVGGTNLIGNILPACRRCNRRSPVGQKRSSARSYSLSAHSSC
jgi:hypothetical protein